MAPPHDGTEEEAAATLGRGGSVALLVFTLFLGFPLAHLLENPPGAVHLALVVAGLATFLVVYLRVMLGPRGRRDTAVSLGVLGLLAFAVSIDDSGEWATMFVYVSAVCGFRLRPPGAQRGIAGATVATAVFSFGARYPADDAASYVVYAVAVGAMLRGYARMATVNRELHAARDEIARMAVARSACASRVTCTTCSGTASPSSR